MTSSPRHSSPSRSCTAFTLIELLVVVAIIAVLASILLPSANNMILKSKLTKKMSSFRQYYTANGLYAVDHDGNTCPVWDATVQPKSPGWQTTLARYMGMENAKDAFFRDTFNTNFDPNQWWLTGTGMNGSLRKPEDNVINDANPGIPNSATKISSVTYPQYRIFVGDSLPDAYWITQTYDLDPTRHTEGGVKKGMYMMFDGRVLMLTKEQATASLNNPATLESLLNSTN